MNSVLLPAPLGPIRPTMLPVLDAEAHTAEHAQAAKAARDCCEPRAGQPCAQLRTVRIAAAAQCTLQGAAEAVRQKDHRGDQAGGEQHRVDIAEAAQQASA